jgi:hypothetical protein
MQDTYDKKEKQIERGKLLFLCFLFLAILACAFYYKFGTVSDLPKIEVKTAVRDTAKASCDSSDVVKKDTSKVKRK